MFSRNFRSFSVLVLAACGGNLGAPDAGGGDTLDPDERALVDRGGADHMSAQDLLSFGDGLLGFDPVIDPSKSATENATLIEAQIKTQANACGTVTVNGATVNADFGAVPGCTFQSGVAVSGSASLGVASASGTVTVSATFTNLVVNGKDLIGSATFTTTNGSSFTVKANLTSGGKTLTADLTVVGSATGMTIGGTLSTKKGDTASNLTFSAVLWRKADCYPSAGSVAVKSGLLSETITFTATTPTTGIAQVVIGRKTTTMTLPAYGACPPGRDAGA